MDVILGLAGFFGVIVCLIILVIKLFKKKPKKRQLIITAAFFCMFLLGLGITPDSRQASTENDVTKEIYSQTGNQADAREEHTARTEEEDGTIENDAAEKEIEPAAMPIAEKTEEELFAETHDVPIEFASAVFSWPPELGISPDEITDAYLVGETENSKLFSITYQGIEFGIGCDSECNLYSVFVGKTEFYSEEIKNVNDYIITSDQRIQLQMWAKESVVPVLKSPSTAKFPGGFLTPYEGWNISKNGNTFAVSSYVDSQNSFGTMIRSKFSMTVVWDLETGDGKITSFIFDGQQLA